MAAFGMLFREKSGEGAEQPVERSVRSLGVRMREVVTTKRDHLAIAIDGGMRIFLAVLSQKALHEPRLGVTLVDVENSVEKDLCDVPAFLRDCPRDVTPVDADHRVLGVRVGFGLRLEKSHREHDCRENDDNVAWRCQGNSQVDCKFVVESSTES